MRISPATPNFIIMTQKKKDLIPGKLYYGIFGITIPILFVEKRNGCLYFLNPKGKVFKYPYELDLYEAKP